MWTGEMLRTGFAWVFMAHLLAAPHRNPRAEGRGAISLRASKRIRCEWRPAWLSAARAEFQ